MATTAAAPELVSVNPATLEPVGSDLDSDRGRVRPARWFPYAEETEEALRAALDVFYGEGLDRRRSAWRHRGALRHLVRWSR